MAGMSAVFRVNMGPALQELRAEEAAPAQSGANGGLSGLASALTSRLSLGPAAPSSYQWSVSQDYASVLERIQMLLDGALIPDVYKGSLVRPFCGYLRKVGAEDLGKLDEGEKVKIEQIARAILQNFDPNVGGPIPQAHTRALHEVISDLSQTFKRPADAETGCLVSALPQWCGGGLVTHLRPDDHLGTKVSVVNVPQRYAMKSAVVWGCLGHEAIGYDVLEAYPGIKEELQGLILHHLNGIGYLFRFWEGWVEESVADVLNILKMGPAAAFSSVAYLQSKGKTGVSLQGFGWAGDEHPIDLVRGFLAVRVLKILAAERPFAGAEAYARACQEMVDADERACPEDIYTEALSLGNETNLAGLLEEFSKSTSASLDLSLSPEQAVSLILADGSGIRDPFLRFIVKKTGMPDWLYQKVRGEKYILTTLHGNYVLAVQRSMADFKKAAGIVAEVIMKAKLSSLGNQSFMDVQCWNEADEKTCTVFRQWMRGEVKATTSQDGKAAHVVAAAVLESIADQGSQGVTFAQLGGIFQRMVAQLEEMSKINREREVTAGKENAMPSASLAASASSPRSAPGLRSPMGVPASAFR